jgi:Fructose-bisphosphate aldolase class-I
MDGDHTIDRSYEVTTATLHSVFDALFEQRVALEGMLLKSHRVLSGYGCPRQAGVEEVVERTLHCYRRVVPTAVPGVAFLSGGQDDLLATAHLNAVNSVGSQPWEFGFSYGRALQARAPEDVAWPGRERPGGPGRLPAPREVQRRGALPAVLGGGREEGAGRLSEARFPSRNRWCPMRGVRNDSALLSALRGK